MPLIDPHSQHCCMTHGCRFNNNDKCSVVNGQVGQLNRCGESSICSEYRANCIDDEDHAEYPYDDGSSHDN